jgi:hypothetical protein
MSVDVHQRQLATTKLLAFAHEAHEEYFWQTSIAIVARNNKAQSRSVQQPMVHDLWLGTNSGSRKTPVRTNSGL